MVSDDTTHAELARTVDDLTQWLSVVEGGLNSMLERFADIIEEEGEELVETDVESEEYSQAGWRGTNGSSSKLVL